MTAGQYPEWDGGGGASSFVNGTATALEDNDEENPVPWAAVFAPVQLLLLLSSVSTSAYLLLESRSPTKQIV